MCMMDYYDCISFLFMIKLKNKLCHVSKIKGLEMTKHLEIAKEL